MKKKKKKKTEEEKKKEMKEDYAKRRTSSCACRHTFVIIMFAGEGRGKGMERAGRRKGRRVSSYSMLRGGRREDRTRERGKGKGRKGEGGGKSGAGQAATTPFLPSSPQASCNTLPPL